MLKKDIKINEKMIYIVIAVVLLLPSIYYLIRGNGIFNLSSNFSFFYLPPTLQITIPKRVGAALLLLVFVGLFAMYLKILKNEKVLFKNNKSTAGLIITASVIFACVLPMNSTDIFYYIGTGWSEAKYRVNPYYTSVQDVIESSEEATQDEILLKTPKIWRDSTVVYGPLWPIICKILSGLSFGSLPLALILYKIFNLLVHLFNCYIMYKLTKKRKFVLLYGLNPLVLFTGLSEVHNDILVVGIILLAIFFFKKKRDIAVTVVLIAIATAIKYYAVLLIPFLVIYYYRKEKVGKRILYSVGWAVLFIVVLASIYLVYTRDIEVFKGISRQQNKVANNFLVEYALKDIEVATRLNKILTGGFVIIYVATITRLLFKKKISFVKGMRTYSNLLLLFTFFVITNFQAWYVMWLFSTIIYQRGRMIEFILNISIAVELANSVYFLLNESVQYAKYYSIALAVAVITLQIENNCKRKLGEINVRKIQGK